MSRFVAHLTFLGYEAENSGGLEQRVERYIEFIGDSITEGILIDEEYRLNNNYEQNNRPFQDDVTATYAYLTAENLKLEPLIMGYGGVGLTKGGSGSVPKAVDAYPFCYNEHYTDMPHPVYVVINYGANDRSVGVEQYLNEYERLLDEVYEHHNETQVIVLSAFCGWCYKELKGFVDNYNLKRERHAQYINTYGWISPTPLHPNREGHIKIANKLTEEMKRRNLT